MLTKTTLHRQIIQSNYFNLSICSPMNGYYTGNYFTVSTCILKQTSRKTIIFKGYLFIQLPGLSFMIAGFLVVLSVADGALVAFSDALKRIYLSLILSFLGCEINKLNITTVFISRVMFHASSYFTTLS